MTASRVEYMKDLLEDIEVVLEEFEGYELDQRLIVAALVLADAVNGLRKTLHGKPPPKNASSKLSAHATPPEG